MDFTKTKNRDISRTKHYAIGLLQINLDFLTKIISYYLVPKCATYTSKFELMHAITLFLSLNLDFLTKIIRYYLVPKCATYTSKFELMHAITLFLSLSSKRVSTSTSLLPCVITSDSFQTQHFSAEWQNFANFFLSFQNIINLFDIFLLAKCIFSYH